MITLLLAAAFVLPLVALALAMRGGQQRRAPRVPPAHPRRDVVAELDRTGEQVDQTVFR